jgi:hypothetical protein
LLKITKPLEKVSTKGPAEQASQERKKGRQPILKPKKRKKEKNLREPGLRDYLGMLAA